MCEKDDRVYEAIALDGKLDMVWRLLQNMRHTEEVPDEKVYPEARSAFVNELQDIIRLANEHIKKTSKQWYKNREGERSDYLSRHELGAVEADCEPNCAPPWKYLKALHYIVDGAIRVTRMYLGTMQMTKWTDAYERAGDHGRAQIVSLPGNVPPVGANEVRRVCLENHAKPKPVAAESLDAVKRSMDDMRHTMDEQLRSD